MRQSRSRSCACRETGCDNAKLDAKSNVWTTEGLRTRRCRRGTWGVGSIPRGGVILAFLRVVHDGGGGVPRIGTDARTG